MGLFHAIILGIIEGVTEFLPISSTGHLILASKLLNIPSSDFLSSFEIAIQGGAILAVLVLYGKYVLLNPGVLKRLLVAFLPAALTGVFLFRLIKHELLNNTPLVLWSLFLGGIFLILFERFHLKGGGKTGGIAVISYRQCFVIGLFQALAVIPGVSRSAATIVGGLLLGVDRRSAVEFSFLLAVPTLMSAAALDLFRSGFQFSSGQLDLIVVGFTTSFIVAVLSIRFFLHFIKNHDFAWFGAYRVALAVFFWWIIV